MKNSNFKITYHQEGDYLIPDLVIKKETNNYQIGKYGYLRLDFLKNHKRGLYCELCLKNELNKHMIYFDEICEKILNSVPKQNRSFIQKQFNQLDDNLMDYISYWNEKYYRNGFCDGVQLIAKCFDE